MSASVLKSGGNILHRISGDVGNADTSYVYFACGIGDGKTSRALRWKPTATTITLEFSNDDLPIGIHHDAATATQLNALDWTDLTTALTGSANQTTNGSQTFDTDFKWKYGRVKLVTTNATNACDLYLNRD